MAQLFLVPALGTRIRLAADWTFTLHREGRNADLFPLAGWHPDNTGDGPQLHRSVSRERDWSGGHSGPVVYKAPISQTVYDFGEALEPESQSAEWFTTEYHGGTGKPLDCHIDGTTVVIDAPLPPEAMRIAVRAARTTPNASRVTLLAGSVLTLDRYYIRNGVGAYDSITFRLLKPGANPNARPAGRRRGTKATSAPVPPGLASQPFGRFWVKLDDANTIQFDYNPGDQPWWFGVADQLVSGSGVDVTIPGVGPARLEPHRMTTRADLPVGGGQLVTKNGSRVALWTPGNRYGNARNHEGDPTRITVDEGWRAIEASEVIGYVAPPAAGSLSEDGDVTLAP